MREAWQKYEALTAVLKEFDQVLVAYSGGVDSAFLLKAAMEALGPDNVLAVTADSETYPIREKDAAVQLAKELGARHIVVGTSELAIPGYAENPINRCYFCKQELFTELAPIAEQHGIQHMVFGAIADDLGDFRPGLKAAKEMGARAPLQEVMLYKREIRYLAKELGLRIWDKPSAACLSSRIPYGEHITKEKLSMVDQAEFFLQQLGFRQVRVRHHERTARIEVSPEELGQVVEVAGMIVDKLKEIGYQYVTLDLQGYRTGSLNEALGKAAAVGK